MMLIFWSVPIPIFHSIVKNYFLQDFIIDNFINFEGFV